MSVSLACHDTNAFPREHHMDYLVGRGNDGKREWADLDFYLSSSYPSSPG
ncbi:MAG: hypothetical protein ABJN69_13790 [Hellea sp.]